MQKKLKQNKQKEAKNFSIDTYYDAVIQKLFNMAIVNKANYNATPKYLQTL